MAPRSPHPSGDTVAPSRRGPLAASLAFYTGSALIVAVALLVGTLGGHIGPAFSIGALAFDGAGVVFSFLATRNPRLSERARHAWRWVLLATLLRTAGVACYVATSSSPSFPGPGDLLLLLSFPVLLCGMLTFPRRPISRLELRKALLDGCTVAVGGVLMMWYFVVQPSLDQHSPSDVAIAAAIALPVGDMVLIFATVSAFSRTTERAARLPLLLFAIGWAWEFAATPVVGQQRVSGVPGSQFPPWLFSLWLVAHFFWAAAAFEQQQTRRGRLSPSALRGGGFPDELPYLGVGVGLCVLLGSTHDAGTTGVTASVAVLTALVLYRQRLVLRENHMRAWTDALTGLANRAQLLGELNRSLGQADRTGRHVGVLLADLDGFKAINDRFGHAAGDQALREFAQMLRRAVLGNDVVGRLGGDEFAIVLNDIGTAENLHAVVHRIHRETIEPIKIGDCSLRLQASIGSALSVPGDQDAAELVERADADMYRVKHGARQADQLR